MNDKIVLITGSSSGIGKETAIHFALLGAKVVITGRRADSVSEVAQLCEQISPLHYKPLEVVADLSIDEDVKRLITTTVNNFGKIDVLVNNAGVTALSAIDDTNLMAKYEMLAATNLRAPLLLIHSTVPYLQETKGCIINVSSLAALKPYPKMTIYCMTKAALNMLTSCLAIELGPRGIRVNSVNPGIMKNRFYLGDEVNEELVKKIWNAYVSVNPSGRIGESIDVARAIAFLASDNASWISGCHLNIDGGSLFANCPTYDELSSNA